MAKRLRMDVVVAAGLVWTLAGSGCIAPAPVTCADGTLCAEGEVCLAGGGCAVLAQVDACLALDEGAPCQWAGVGDGLCAGGACVISLCGDGEVRGAEVCDDGNRVDGDGCSAFCSSLEACGNGVRDLDEACDDGNLTGGDGCQADCALPRCGDGVVDLDEACDDGGTQSGDGCSASCASAEACGNGIVDLGEQCDDGNLLGGDGCQADCRVAVCGDGVVDAVDGEACDDGNEVVGDDCIGCALARCGDGIRRQAPADVDDVEACDDGNLADDDFCTAACEPATCGDLIVATFEACDDGNAISGDGCAQDCSAVCGDGTAGLGEACDDGNAVDRDGCAPTCAIADIVAYLRSPGDDATAVLGDPTRPFGTAQGVVDALLLAGPSATSPATIDVGAGAFGDVALTADFGEHVTWVGQDVAASRIGAVVARGADESGGAQPTPAQPGPNLRIASDLRVSFEVVASLGGDLTVAAPSGETSAGAGGTVAVLAAIVGDVIVDGGVGAFGGIGGAGGTVTMSGATAVSVSAAGAQGGYRGGAGGRVEVQASVVGDVVASGGGSSGGGAGAGGVVLLDASTAGAIAADTGYATYPSDVGGGQISLVGSTATSLSAEANSEFSNSEGGRIEVLDSIVTGAIRAGLDPGAGWPGGVVELRDTSAPPATVVGDVTAADIFVGTRVTAGALNADAGPGANVPNASAGFGGEVTIERLATVGTISARGGEGVPYIFYLDYCDCYGAYWLVEPTGGGFVLIYEDSINGVVSVDGGSGVPEYGLAPGAAGVVIVRQTQSIP